MKFREYINLILHPGEFTRQLAKWKSYAATLEQVAGLVPLERVLIDGRKDKPHEAVVIIGDRTRVQDCVFTDSAVLVIHPDARDVMISYCTFMGNNMEYIKVGEVTRIGGVDLGAPDGDKSG